MIASAAIFKEAGFGVEPNRKVSASSTGLQSAGSTGSLNQPNYNKWVCS